VPVSHEVLRGAARAVLVLAAPLPFLPALFDGWPVLGALGHALDAWFGFQCERDPSRMLAVGSVCARCVGIYVGLGLGALVGFSRASERALRTAILVGFSLMVVDVLSEMAGVRPAWAPLRVLAGFVFGAPVGVAAERALRVTVGRC